MILRPYQEIAVQDASDALDKHKNTIVVAPTGAGKTIMLSAYITPLALILPEAVISPVN